MAVQTRYQTVRGKNLLFLATLGSLLQIDKLNKQINFADFKRAFSPEVVRNIHEVIPVIWPSYDDYVRSIRSAGVSVGALYTGSYDPASVIRAVTRHSLYSERIFLVDPFLHPFRVRNQFNPVLHPEEHRSNAVKFSFLWWSLAPWIMHGLVSFIRTPGDFDTNLEHEVMEITDAKLEANPDLRSQIERYSEEAVAAANPFDRDMGEYWLLSHSDNQLLEMMRGFKENPFKTDAEFLSYIKKRRDRHPYYVERLPGQTSEITISTSGTSYEMAKRICSIGDFHLITDLVPRWFELQLDYSLVRGNLRNWSPFSKALQNANLRVLDKVPLPAALRLRKENRLESMRLFLRKIWQSSRTEEEFSEENALNLAAELNEKINEAEAEYKRIDRQLLKWIGASAVLLASGVGDFVPRASAAAVTGALSLISSEWQRRSFKVRYPAGFFLNVKR